MDTNCHKTPNEEDDLRNDFKKGDLSDWTWNGCCARRTGLSISETADLLGFSHTTISRVYREKEKISSERQLCERKCLVDVRGEWADWLEMIERQQ